LRGCCIKLVEVGCFLPNLISPLLFILVVKLIIS
jgi:hypothetical protein